MKTLVVGAGAGGLASALLSSLRGEDVTLIESHNYLGGCSSYFKRGPFIFDVGATTISGLGDTEPLGILFKLLGSAPPLQLADPGIVFHMESGKTISYYHDFELWMKELERHFPHLNHRPFWKLVRKVNAQGWDFLKNIQSFPIHSALDLLPFLKHPQSVGLIPHLLISTEIVLKYFQLNDPEYLKLINGMLLISAQNHAENAPFLVGAMGLSYPAETYAPIGGMKGVVDFFETELIRRKVRIQKQSRLQSFTSHQVKMSSGHIYPFEKLILNLPIWNLAEYAEGDLKKQFMREAETFPGYWGAFTIFFGVKSHVNSPYHQVHLGLKEVDHYFVSFSLPEDTSRAPENFQTVTISTHVKASDWLKLPEEIYLEKKKMLTAIILNDFCQRFSIEDLRHVTSGTPRTFLDFTGRSSGFVGGIPLLLGKSPFSLLSPIVTKQIFRVGDTVFPGQGWPGVVAGALALHERIKSF